MSNIVYISFAVMTKSFDHVAPAIKEWSDTDSSGPTDYPGADIVVIDKGGDLYLLSKDETDAPLVGFRRFDLAFINDFLALFPPL